MERLKIARKAKGMTQSELAERISVSRQAYSSYETGVRDPDTKTLLEIANILEVDLDFLLGRTDTPTSKNSQLIPLLGSVPAGTPIEAIEDIETYIDYFPNFVKHGELFALRVKGDSMAPELKNGDIAIIEKQDFINNGDIAVVRVNGEDVTIKRVKPTRNGIRLVPTNPAYDSLEFSKEEVATLPVTIVGKLIEIRRRF
ncbi:MAG: helix-turn-helix domain-containing protein [Anaerolineaceae bacterium]|nr:helix-turn-helix domain-containing protein [Anaerolineaceae bacterium]